MFQETLKELFPSWKAVGRHREVILFAVGLMKHPGPLVQHMYEIQIGDYLNTMRACDGPEIDADLFNLLHAESRVRLVHDPLNNKYINHYDHGSWGGDNKTTTIYCPSRIYHFKWMQKDVVLDEHKEQNAQIHESAMYIYEPREMVTKSLLSTCRMISEHQAVTDLQMKHVDCDGKTEAEAPILSRNIQSLYIRRCKLHFTFIRNIVQQLHNCVKLMRLRLENMNLRALEQDLDELLDNLVSNHEEGSSQNKLRITMFETELSKEFVVKWNSRCERITSIECIIR